MIGKLKKETRKFICIDDFVCLTSKEYAFKCGDDGKNNVKGFSNSPSKTIEFDEDKKCLGGVEV